MKQSYLPFYKFLVITLLCLFSTTFVFADDDDDDEEEVDTVYRLETGMNQLARQEVIFKKHGKGFFIKTGGAKIKKTDNSKVLLSC